MKKEITLCDICKKETDAPKDETAFTINAVIGTGEHVDSTLTLLHIEDCCSSCFKKMVKTLKQFSGALVAELVENKGKLPKPEDSKIIPEHDTAEITDGETTMGAETWKQHLDITREQIEKKLWIDAWDGIMYLDRFINSDTMKAKEHKKLISDYEKANKKHSKEQPKEQTAFENLSSQFHVAFKAKKYGDCEAILHGLRNVAKSDDELADIVTMQNQLAEVMLKHSKKADKDLTPFDKFLAEADAARAEKNWSTAIDRYLKCLKLQPTNEEVATKLYDTRTAKQRADNGFDEADTAKPGKITPNANLAQGGEAPPWHGDEDDDAETEIPVELQNDKTVAKEEDGEVENF